MTDNAPTRTLEQQRRAATRTALVLAVVAIAVFAGFLWMSARP